MKKQKASRNWRLGSGTVREFFRGYLKIKSAEGNFLDKGDFPCMIYLNVAFKECEKV